MDFHNLNYDELDKNLDKDLKEYNKKKLKYIILIALVLLFLFKGTILFWLKFSIAIPTRYESQDINVTMKPIQINYSDEKIANSKFLYKTLLDFNKKIEITPKAKYIISGMVVAYNYSFFNRSEFFDSAALYDIGIAWDKLADKNFYKKYFSCYSQKNEMTGSRILWTQAKTTNIPGFEKNFDFNKLPYSHTHIVPANRNIMAALLNINTWDKVELEGYLINMRYVSHNIEYTSKSSMSRDDTAPYGDNGNGSCEQMYVTRVKIGHFVYE